MEEYKRYLYLDNMVVIENGIWATSYVYNYLFHMNIVTNIIDKMILIPVNTCYTRFSIRHIVPIKNKLILIPNYNRKIIIFNIEDENFLVIDVKQEVPFKFCAVIAETENVLCGVTGLDNKIYRYHITKDLISAAAIGNEYNHYDGIFALNKSVNLLLAYNSRKVIVDDGKDITEVDMPDKVESRSDNIAYNNFVVLQNYAYLFPRWANCILQLSIEKRTLSVVNNQIFDSTLYKNGQIFTCCGVVNDKIYVYEHNTHSWIVWSFDNNILGKYEVRLSRDQAELINKNNIIEQMQGDKVLENRDIYTLVRYLSDLIES